MVLYCSIDIQGCFYYAQHLRNRKMCQYLSIVLLHYLLSMACRSISGFQPLWLVVTHLKIKQYIHYHRIWYYKQWINLFDKKRGKHFMVKRCKVMRYVTHKKKMTEKGKHILCDSNVLFFSSIILWALRYISWDHLGHPSLLEIDVRLDVSISSSHLQINTGLYNIEDVEKKHI